MQTWGSAMILSKHIAEDPNVLIPLCNPPSFPNRFHQRPLRILELGAGTGLVSLAVAKIASLLCDRQARSSIDEITVEIFATDYDRAVLSNLRDNIRRNEPLNGCVSLKACSLDWEQYYQLRMGRDRNMKEDLHVASDPQGEKLRTHSFDVILAADVVYGLQHAEWLKATVQSLLRYPGHDATTTSQSVDNPLFHLVAPIRHTHRAELESIVQVFSPCATPAPDSRDRAAQYRLSILRSHHIDDGEESGFIWYEIGWVLEQYFPAATALDEQIDTFSFALL
jgi:SAM-dependent methyltransferase